MSRRTQPYRAGKLRPQTQVLMNMLRGRTTSGFNPADVHRGLQRMARAARPPATGRPPRQPRPSRERRPPR